MVSRTISIARKYTIHCCIWPPEEYCRHSWYGWEVCRFNFSRKPFVFMCVYSLQLVWRLYFHLSECILYSKTLRREQQREMDPQGFSCFPLNYTLLIIDLVIPWVVLAVSLDASSILWQVGR